MKATSSIGRAFPLHGKGFPDRGRGRLLRRQEEDEDKSPHGDLKHGNKLLSPDKYLSTL